MATSLIVPVAYITVLVAALAIFSRVYRKRRAAEKRAYDPWFPSHPTRDTYITLLSSPTPVPDNLLKSALLCRAQADVKRIWRLKDDKAALASLHQRGLVGDETMARFEAAEKELEAELVDVVQEANTFRQGWGGIIFATATEMAQAERTREVVLSIPKMRAAEEKKLARRARYTTALDSIKPSTANSTLAATNSSTPSTPARASTSSASPAAAAASTPTSKLSNTSIPSATSASGTGVSSAAGVSGTGDGSGSASPAASASAGTSRAGSRSASPGPNEGLNVPQSGAGSAAGTPSKSTPNKKKKGKK